MYPVSDNFKTEVYAPARMVKARVTFDISDVAARGDVISITTTAEAIISDKNQLINKVRNQSYNLATCEPGRFKLDGSFSFADDTKANNKEMGFVSSGLCRMDGDFTPYPTITFQFGSIHSSAGLTITFDAIQGEYATDFNVTAYDIDNRVITNTDVACNDSVQYLFNQQIDNYKKIVVTIKKWSRGERRARLAEVDFGIVRTYTDNNLIKCSLIEELDLTTGKLPSAEFKFTVDNANREFNILNPSGFYRYLQQRQIVLAELGLESGALLEYVPVGNYLLWDWTSDEGSLTASFTARTNLDLMSNFDYENLVAKTNYSLYQMAVDVFASCGITNHSIDNGLQGITTNAVVKKTDCRSLLQMIALAGCAVIFVSRSGLITLKINPSSPETAVDTIDMDNMYADPKIELDKIVKSVTVKYWTDLSISATVTADNSGVDVGDVLKLENNTLINTSSRATVVANWILSQKSYRAIYSLNWRGNPAQELNDVLSIENPYGDNKKAIVTKTSLEYQGYLNAKTEARGMTDAVG